MTQESYIDTIIKEENIFPVYQPVVSLTKGDIFGYEALSRVRQDSAHAAPLPIGEIFQMAEQSGHLWDLSLIHI